MNQETNDDAAPEAARAEGEIAGPSLDERLAKAEAELAETKDKLLRALAETENQRRRAQREREDAQRYAAAAFAKDMLDVADNLHRALASVPGDAAQDERVRGAGRRRRGDRARAVGRVGAPRHPPDRAATRRALRFQSASGDVRGRRIPAIPPAASCK